MKNVKIVTKIYLGFGLLLALLLTISVLATIELSIGNSEFKEYRAIAQETNKTAQIHANFLETRVAVNGFLVDSSAENIAVVKERKAKTSQYIKDLQAMIPEQDHDKMGKVAEIEQRFNDYKAAFDEVTQLQISRDEIVDTALDKYGPQIEHDLAELLNKSYQGQNADAVYWAGRALQSLLDMRIYTKGFVENKQDETLKLALKKSAEFRDVHAKMMARLNSPVLVKLGKDAGVLHAKYEAAFIRLSDIVKKWHGLVADKLETIAPTIDSEVEHLKMKDQEIQAELGPATSASMESAIVVTIVIAAISIVVAILTAWVIGTGTSRPIVLITAAMKTLAEGDKTVEIPGNDRKDEAGAMAAAVNFFKENMIKADALAEQQRLNDEETKRREEEERLKEEARQAEEREREEAERQRIAQQEEEERQRELETARLAAERAQKIEQLNSAFDEKVANLLSSVSNAFVQLTTTAESMSDNATDTSQMAVAVSAAAEEASTNVQTVAAASEQLSASIREISRQVGHSGQITNDAVAKANIANEQMQELVVAAGKIDEVVSLITDIAEQTNLLALNATIEAARAGDSGKGFAVVANEVKNLASQTSSATDEISGQIKNVQEVTRSTVTAIEDISATINQINDISSTIAAAVNEQSAATQEISKNVEEAAMGTRDVTENITGVSSAADMVGSASRTVLTSTTEMKGQTDQVRSLVESYLTDIKAA